MKDLVTAWDMYKDWLKQDDDINDPIWYSRDSMGYNFSDFMKWLSTREEVK